jgi:putative transposase
MQILRIGYGIRGFATVCDDGLKWNRMLTDKAKHKVKVIIFWEKHGLDATLDAFPHKRSTLFEWKRTLKTNNGRLESLNEKSKRPKKMRSSDWDEKTILFVEDLRKKHPRIGKDKVKVLLDNYCTRENIKCSSVSTIGRIIVYLKEKNRIPSGKKVYLSGKTGLILERKPIKKRKKLRRKGYLPQDPGDLVQVDTIVKFINGLKRYIITAIDLNSDFAFAFAYSSASSVSTKDFFDKMEQVAPFKIKRIQTDNGSEFEHRFRDYVKERNITHYHNYPKNPRMNAFVERFNRTIQEEFVDWNMQELAHDIDSFNEKLINWLLWYNTERPHHSLKMISPMQFIINNLFLTPQKSRMYWTHTST